MITKFTGDANADTLVCDCYGNLFTKNGSNWFMLNIDPEGEEKVYWEQLDQEGPDEDAQCVSIHSVTWLKLHHRPFLPPELGGRTGDGPAEPVPYLILYLTDITGIDGVVATLIFDPLNPSRQYFHQKWGGNVVWTLLSQGDWSDGFMDNYWASYSMGDIEFWGLLEQAPPAQAPQVPVRQERRFDPYDGKAYTKDEFLDYYGDLVEWDFMAPKKILIRNDLFKIMNSLDGLSKEGFNLLLDKIIETYL
tara:strand:+ start:1677 stop:2423 length:747 start_codon:yes stop_codon:yes gene_type:complete